MIKIEIKEEQFENLCKKLGESAYCPEDLSFKDDYDGCEDCKQCWKKALLGNINNKEC